jgi:hypothetical protein
MTSEKEHNNEQVSTEGSAISSNADDSAPHDYAPHDSAPHDYVSHNYDAMNRAIDTEVDKRFELNELYRFQQTSRRTLMFLHITSSLCVIAVTAVIIWWFFHQTSPVFNEPSPTFNGAFDRSTSDALSLISDQEKNNESEQNYINTSFTVFHRTLVPTGEYVVTGKTYQPEDLSSPDEQYCYLEKNQSSDGLTGLPLASINESEYIIETDDNELIGFARQYCQFSK